ncbi:hypothetical protein AGMMS49975_28180 [Clostridia bacterium]|nr:hypothetical protein AGMMS49975_28180 [Clostridia bacterium]
MLHSNSANLTKELERILERLEIIYAPFMNSEDYHSDGIDEII